MTSHHTIDVVTLIAGFYGQQYTGSPIQTNRDYNNEMLALIGKLHDSAFPDYRFDAEQFLAQAKAQLRGNELAVRNYHFTTFRFAPVSGNGSPLVVHMGATKTFSYPDGTLSIWTDAPEINKRFQRVFKGEGEIR